MACIKTGHVWAVSQTGGTDDLSAVGGESGQCVRGESSKWGLEYTSPPQPHKLFGAVSIN